MRKALKISTDGTTMVLDLDSEAGALKTLQNGVGGYIERLELVSLNIDMWCNEDGIAEQLPLNPYAAALVRGAYPNTTSSYAVLGDVVLTPMNTDEEDDGETRGFSDGRLARIEGAIAALRNLR